MAGVGTAADSAPDPTVAPEHHEQPAGEIQPQPQAAQQMAPYDVNGMQNPNLVFQQPMAADFAQQTDPTMLFNMTPGLPQTGFEQFANAPISADEIALYDRQIRLWGVKAQELIRNANILLIGIRALGNEIAKNLVLAGVGTLTILDDSQVTEDDLGSQFLYSAGDLGTSKAEAAAETLRKMNPRVNLFTDSDLILAKEPEYFSTFHITIATNQPVDLCQNINMCCRSFRRKFYAADTHGVYGYIFSDLFVHDFVIEKQKGNIATQPTTMETLTRSVLSVSTRRDNDKVIEIVTKQEVFSPLMIANASPLPPEAIRTRRTKRRVPALLTCLRALFDFEKASGNRLPNHTAEDLRTFAQFANQRHLELELPMETLSSAFLRKFLQNLGSELSPTCAFLGGELAQDVINVLGRREQPLQNFMLFDGDEFKNPIYSLHPINDPNIGAQMEQLTFNGDENGVGPEVGGNGMDTTTGTIAQTEPLQAPANGGDRGDGPTETSTEVTADATIAATVTSDATGTANTAP